MSNNQQSGMKTGVVLGLIIGCIVSFIAYQFMSSTESSSDAMAKNNQETKEPLYWVAPMDANFRKDKPGKSPMGMDLVPVYEEKVTGPDEGEGTIRISSHVENNLGVKTATAEIKPLHSIINTLGYVAYNEENFVKLHPRVQGWIETLYVSVVGDPVTKGQPLYQLYSPELVNAQEELLLALDRKNNRLINAAENRLLALGFPEQAIEKLRKTRKTQQKVTFYAPQSGVVESLTMREGMFVTPETMMLSIVDLSDVWIKADVFENQSAQVSMGDSALVTLDFLPEQQWQGKIEHIHPMVNAETRAIRVRLSVDNPNHQLKPNMFGQISIQTSLNESALLIPKEALIRTGHQNRVVLALGEGSFKSVAVKTGRFNQKNVEIIEGLSEGERVVTSAQFLLDSESSKTSDFKRLAPHTSNEDTSLSTWVNAQVESKMAEERMLTLIHEPIPEWDWPEMTMDFTVIEDVDLSLFEEGRHLRVKINKKATGGYQVINVEVPDIEINDSNSVSDHSHH